MRRPTPDETWMCDDGLICLVDDQSEQTRYIYHPWSEVRAIRKHLRNGGTIHNCPIEIDRWTMGEILKDMADDNV